ncbi:hypothetical protein Ssi03_34440 [Sphaerisporangium siamense]|uniref:Uncharacterized protein n=1 Tax=Sphaerisporangium siamense TaxID=795645 RepID=A0A7W7G905_9ACTN|nr:hypothetical protein [Sphaerisporangium siamense]MBB4698486.1 hypothetical protein [Sphaerisporangium siamense]GII85454.1 hypothetical protein Ssi03_34440 [Sphaerisporangium siamense]
MLKSRARRRIATKAAVAGVIGTGVIFGALPALGAFVGPTPVTYTCKSGNTTLGTYNFQVSLDGPLTTPSPSETVTLTWVVGQPTATPSFTATSVITPSTAVQIEGQLVASGPPLGPAPITPKPTTSYAPLATISPGDPLPLPTMTATVVPTAVGQFSVKPGNFTLKLGANSTYTCEIAAAPSPANATAVPLTIVVASPSASPSASPTGSTTSSNTPTATPTPTRTPKPTHTVYETVTHNPEQVKRKPSGGAATGGGADAGPDGRLFVAAGMVLVVGAGVGGLVVRHRRPNRG